MKSVFELAIDMKSDILEIMVDSKILLSSVFVGAALSFIKTYLFSDMRYLIWLLIAIGLDVLAKLYSIWFVEKSKFDFETLINKLTNKILKYTIYLIGSYVLINFEVDGKKLDFLGYANPLIYGTLIVKEVNSIRKKIGMSLPKKINDVLDQHFDNEENNN